MATSRHLVAIHLTPTNWMISYAENGRCATLILRDDEKRAKDDSSISQAKGRVAQLRQLLAEQHIKPTSPVLILPAAWCMAATISTDGLLKRHKREAMIFRLEEKLPLDAEAVAADFINGGSSTEVLGVCTEIQRLLPIISALEDASLAPVAICPAPLLQLQQLIDDRQVKDVDVVALGDDRSVNIFTLRDAHPVSWHICTADPQALIRQLHRQLLARTAKLRVLSVGLDPALHEPLAALPDLITSGTTPASAGSGSKIPVPAFANTPTASEGDIPEMPSVVSQIALQGHLPLTDLRRGRLAPRDRLQQMRRPLAAAMVAGVCCLLACGGILLWRAHRYRQFVSTFAQQETELFQQAFPHQPVPLAIRSRLTSEVERLRGVNGTPAPGSSPAPGSNPGSATRTSGNTGVRDVLGGMGNSVSAKGLPSRLSDLALLKTVLTALPRNLRYRLLELRLDGPQLYMAGQARAHSAADVIVQSLRRNGRMDIDPPRTENLSGRGVSFTITGTVREEPIKPQPLTVARGVPAGHGGGP